MKDLLKNIFQIPIVKAQASQVTEVAVQTQDQISQLIGTILMKIPLWVTALIVFILSFVIARVVKNIVENRLLTEGVEEEHKELTIVAGRTAYVAVLIMGLTIGLKIAGIDLTTIIAGGAFGIGFALKDLIMNFIAGVIVLSARHFTIGDIILVKGHFGKIEEIQARATIIKKFDGTKVVIPNATLFKNSVISYTSNPFRRVEVLVGFTYDTNLKKALKICKEVALNTKNVVAEPKPRVFFYEIGDSEVLGKVFVYVESKKGILTVRNLLIQNLFNEFKKHKDIKLTYPRYKIEVSDDKNIVDDSKKIISEEKSVSKERVDLIPSGLTEQEFITAEVGKDTAEEFTQVENQTENSSTEILQEVGQVTDQTKEQETEQITESQSFIPQSPAPQTNESPTPAPSTIVDTQEIATQALTSQSPEDPASTPQAPTSPTI